MKLLLDTCSFLWITNAQTELSSGARAAFEDEANETYLSVVSALGNRAQKRPQEFTAARARSGLSATRSRAA